jgi:hypothetical protein
MNCPEFHEHLQRRLDGEPLAEAAAPHLEACAECRALFDAAGRLETGLRLLTPPPPPPDLAPRTLGRVVAARRARLRWRWAAGVALAASVAVVAVVLWSRQPAHEEPAPLARKEIPPPKETPPEKKELDGSKEPAEPPLRPTLAQARDAVDRWTERFWDKTREQAELWRDVTVPLEVSRVDFGGSPVPPKQASPHPGLGTGLKTVAALTKRGLNFMARDSAPLWPVLTAVVADQLAAGPGDADRSRDRRRAP